MTQTSARSNSPHPTNNRTPSAAFLNRGLREARSQAAASTQYTTSGGITHREPFSSHPHRGLRRVRTITGVSAATPNS